MKLRTPKSTRFPYTTLSRSGGSVPLRVTLGVAGLASSVEVTADTPTIDPKKMTTSTNVTNEELQQIDRKSTRLNSSHGYISYAVFCWKKKMQTWVPLFGVGF